MPIKPEPGETRESVARRVLGDARLTDELIWINGQYWLRDEQMGPMAKYGAPNLPRNMMGRNNGRPNR